MSIYLYEHTYAYPISMSIFKRLNRLDLEIHEVSHQECIAINGYVIFH
jgi:hypothetical protein